MFIIEISAQRKAGSVAALGVWEKRVGYEESGGELVVWSGVGCIRDRARRLVCRWR
jgi:hypothetical protein